MGTSLVRLAFQILACVLACANPTGVFAQSAASRTVPTLTPIAFPTDAREARTSAVRRVRATLARNERIGEMQDGLFCGGRSGLVFNDKAWESISRNAARIYREELERAGYPVVRGADSAFADASRPTTPDLDVGVTLRKIAAELCLRNPNSMSGQVTMELRFELYSPIARKVLLDVTTEGQYTFNDEQRLGADGVFGGAMRAAVRNLMADPRLSQWLSGALALPAPEQVAAAFKIRVEKVAAQPTAGNVTALRAAVATVQTPTGTGSGFFVSSEGHLLTNQHVVGTNRFVRVKLTTGREIAGEVLKVDAARDVALIKTEPIAVPPLAIRSGEANVGEDVFVLGSPLGDTFNSSLTKGVLSGHRQVGELRYIQSDASILPGSSGGPLLDGNSSVLGITVRGVRAEVGNMSLFIPIAEALARLGVELQN